MYLADQTMTPRVISREQPSISASRLILTSSLIACRHRLIYISLNAVNQTTLFLRTLICEYGGAFFCLKNFKMATAITLENHIDRVSITIR